MAPRDQVLDPQLADRQVRVPERGQCADLDVRYRGGLHHGEDVRAHGEQAGHRDGVEVFSTASMTC